MAEVQLALQRGPAGFEKLVVVKLVHENLASQKPFVDMLLDEARLAALVKHPNVVDIYDLGEVDGRYFIAMEYLEGEPLLAVLRAGRNGQRLDVLSTARLIADTAEGLDAAHELRSMAGDPIELVHHDVSLGNIVVLYNGQVKLVDFGVAKATQSAVASTKVQGKFGYMAPEKLRGGRGDRRSDIWSLGCVLWEALTLKRLFKGGTDSETMQQVLETTVLAPSAVNRGVPIDLDTIVLRTLERDPDRRYPTAKAVAADLEHVLRAHGYAAKNDAIARHMQTTFRTHIAARKQLLQQVSSKGRATADVLEAAFHEGSLASGTPLSIPVDRVPRTLGAQMPVEHTRVRAASADHDPAPVLPRSPTQAHPPQTASDGVPVVGASGGAVRKRWLIYLGAAAGGIAIALAASAVFDADDAAPMAEPTVSATPPVTAPPRVAPAPAAADPAPGQEPSPAPEPAAVEPSPAPAPAAVEPSPAPPGAEPTRDETTAAPGRDVEPVAPKPPPGPPRRPSATRSAQPAPDRLIPSEVTKAALQAWVRGDAQRALALYKRVVQASPTYAPAWRGIGLVYERLGEKQFARAAYQKYLQLAPGAPDAAGIRARLGAP